MQRIVPSCYRPKPRRQPCNADAKPDAGMMDATSEFIDEDGGAPFALATAVQGGGRDARGLETLMRLLERPDPVFFFEEDDLADSLAADGERRAALDAAGGPNFDSLLSMPGASDLSVVSVVLRCVHQPLSNPSPAPPPRPCRKESLSESESFQEAISWALALITIISLPTTWRSRSRAPAVFLRFATEGCIVEPSLLPSIFLCCHGYVDATDGIDGPWDRGM